VRRTVVDPRFQAVLANLIMAAGIRQADLARQSGVSRSHLSQILNGNGNPSEETARRLDEALGAKGQLLNLIVLGASPEDRDQIAGAVRNPRRIGFATLDALARTLASQRHLDDVVGSASVMGSALAQLNVITVMVTEATGPDRPPLLYEGAQWAEFVAWLHISVDKKPEAKRWLGQAMQWAWEISDANLLATIQSYQAHLAWLSLEFGPALGLAEAALRDVNVYPGQRAYDAYQAARGYAVRNNLSDARRMLALADQLAHATETWNGEVPPWQYYRGPWLWSLERGLVWLYAARHDRRYARASVTELRAGMAAMPVELRGADWAGEYMTKLAAAHRLAGQHDEAKDLLDTAQAVAEATRSGRVLRLVGESRRVLRIDELGL